MTTTTPTVERDSAAFSRGFLEEVVAVLNQLDTGSIDRCVQGIRAVRSKKGRLFILGVGGSAGHASHAVNDFRKLCAIEAYCPTDNVSELTARTNDEGWDTTFLSWLQCSRLSNMDAVLVMSVGGGDRERGISANIVGALDLARNVGADIFGIVGRNGGYTASVADACVVIPPLFPEHITPLTEGLCAVVWHLMVSHPLLQVNDTKWESTR